MEERRFRIPQRLDEPARILFLYRWEVMLLFAGLFGGLMANQLIFALLAAVGIIFLLRKFAAALDGLSVQILGYWFIGMRQGGDILPMSWKRYWRG